MDARGKKCPCKIPDKKVNKLLELWFTLSEKDGEEIANSRVFYNT